MARGKKATAEAEVDAEAVEAEQPAQRNGRKMSAGHRSAISESRTVRAYMEALEANAPKRGRKRTRESIEARLTAVNEELEGGAGPFERLLLTQEKFDLEQELMTMDHGGSEFLKVAEDAFIEVGKSFAERKGISYQAFREAGVPAQVLKDAGIIR